MIDAEHFKKAVGKFVTGVLVASTKHEDKYFGLTINSFSSVSLNPSLVSFCLSRYSRSFEAFSKSEDFNISILSEDQSQIAKLFSSINVEKFQKPNYFISPRNQCPIIKDSASILECRKKFQYECGDHDIFVGEVRYIEIEEYNPLIYLSGLYHKLSQMPE